MDEEKARNHDESTREFAAMEQFLIDFSKRKPKKFFEFDLEEYFGSHPLTRENYEKIKSLLGGCKKYDVICAKYGIETQKLGYEEYAKKYGIAKKRAKLYYSRSTIFPWDFAIKLYHMAFQPQHLRRYVFDAQFKLRNMMKAYDELTEKNTANEHHVGICDELALGRDLLSYGYDTLEEIQKADRNFLTNDKYGLKELAASRVSKVLAQHGLENTLWRGVLQRVCDDKEIYVVEDYSEVKIFWRKREFDIDVASLKDTLNGLVLLSNCSGYDAERIYNGDIWIHFNPTRHTAADRHYVIEKVVAELNKSNLILDED